LSLLQSIRGGHTAAQHRVLLLNFVRQSCFVLSCFSTGICDLLWQVISLGLVEGQRNAALQQMFIDEVRYFRSFITLAQLLNSSALPKRPFKGMPHKQVTLYSNPSNPRHTYEVAVKTTHITDLDTDRTDTEEHNLSARRQVAPHTTPAPSSPTTTTAGPPKCRVG